MRFLICTFFLSAVTITLPGQCPDRDSLWKRILILQEAAPPNHANQLKELLGYEKKMSACSNKADSVYTALLMRISALYYLLADFADAIHYSKKTLQTIALNTSNPAIRKKDIVKSYYYLTIFYDSLKMIQQKNEAADSCIFYEKKIGSDYRYTCFLMAFKVKDLFFKGEYNLCADYAALGELLTRKYYNGSDSMDHVIFFIAYHTNSLNLLKRFAEAETFLQSKKAQFLTDRNKRYSGIIYDFLGYVNKVRGENQKAADNFKKAFGFDVQTENKDIAAEVLCQLGLIYSGPLHQLKQGLQYFHKALLYAKGFNSFYVLGTMAKTFTDEKMFDSAYHYFQQAFNSIQPGINESDLLLHMDAYVYANSVEYVLNIVLDKGDTYLQEYSINHNRANLEKALNVYRIGDKLLNRIKAEQSEVKSRLFWRSYTRRLYEHAIEACYLAKSAPDAFYFFEKSRAVVLNDQLNEQHWLRGDEFLKLAQAKKKILQKAREMIITAPASRRFEEIQEEQYANKKELGKLEELIKDRYAVYYQGNIDSGFISLPELSADLDAGNQNMLEIFSGDSAIFTLFITPQSVEFKQINKLAFEETVKLYISCISDFDLLNSNWPRFRKVSCQLYNLIFQDKQIPAGRIIISPDEQYFPFECLISDNRPASPVYFLNNHPVSYTYSARYLQNNFGSAAAGYPGSFMGMAPLNFSPQLKLSALGGSNTSLHKISEYFPDSKMLTEKKATKTSFQQQFPDYKIIQLYTHASDSSDRKEPVIYFNDSALYLSDLIPEKKPVTRLIVLSACETGNGTLYQGEGVY